MSAYYNENNKHAAKWLNELIAEGKIAPGEVDERSITEVRPEDLRGFRQCHFFAGIGGWSLALRLAGVPDDEPVWTGSCPCQPFSSAGAGGGFDDERHLWPAFFSLIRQLAPPVVLGEQVASKVALRWLDLVFDDLEGTGYSCGAADLCAASVGAPHVRQRLFWVADSSKHRQQGDMREAAPQTVHHRTPQTLAPWHSVGSPFQDWKKLLAEPSVSRMADGVPSTLDIRPRLHAFGNAIVPELAAHFISAALEAVHD